MTAEAPPTTPTAQLAPAVDQPRRSRRAIGVGILVALVAAYALSLLGVHLLEKSEAALPPLDLGTAEPEDTVVQDGSWIDQAIVQWVLIALAAAMTLYIFAWVRQGD
jgi:H+/gluconate symporter-like permease